MTFAQILLRIQLETIPAVSRKESKFEIPLDTVIRLLQEHVTEMTENTTLTDQEMLKIITDKKLLSEIGHLDESGSINTARFLASYIVLSQILFLRLFSRSREKLAYIGFELHLNMFLILTMDLFLKLTY